jgi:uncharacterized repeat protein (TIGR01451 family)
MSQSSGTWIQRLGRPFAAGDRPARGPASTRTRRRRSPAMEGLEDRALPSVTIAATNNNGQGYAGLDYNHSGGFVPPDTVGAAGPSSYVETVNQMLAIYSPKATGATAVLSSFTNFWSTQGHLAKTDPGSSLSDPMVVYDEQIGRFIVGDQDVDSNTLMSNFDLAVSRTSSPATLTAADWNFYRISTTERGYDADYPGNFGYNHDAFVFTLNMFGPNDHVLVTSVSASDLAAGVSQAQLHTFKNDLGGFSYRPATMHDAAAGDPMWLISEGDDNASINVVKMTNVLSGAAGFQTTNLAVNSYSGVVPPLNPNGTMITDNIDSRIMKVAEAKNTLVASHAVSASRTEDDARWYAVDVGGGTPVLKDQGSIGAGNRTYLYYPSIDINPAGQIGMTYMRSGNDTSTDYMSMYVTGRTPGDAGGMMEAPVKVPAGAGRANYSDFSGGRAGDMSGINVDPTDGSFWAANEFANTEASANWGTAIADFTLGPAAQADLSVTASGPASVTAGTGATYTITLTNGGPSPAPNLVLTDTLPAGSVFVSLTPSGGNPERFTVAQSGGTVTATATGAVAAGNTDSFILVVSAPAGLRNGAAFSDVASVGSGAGDPNPANNSATASGAIVNNTPPADLAVTNGGPGTSTEGSMLIYSLKVTNNGSSDATNVVLTDALGSNLTFVAAVPSQGTFTQANGVVTVSLGTIPAGKSATATVTALAIEEGSLSAMASAVSDLPDPNTSNNTAAATTTVAEGPIVVSAPLTTSSRSLSNAPVATFTHAAGVEPASAFKATINWGDGTTSSGSISLAGTTYTVRGSHAYSSRSNTFTITTTVTEVGNAPRPRAKVDSSATAGGVPSVDSGIALAVGPADPVIATPGDSASSGLGPGGSAGKKKSGSPSTSK